MLGLFHQNLGWTRAAVGKAFVEDHLFTVIFFRESRLDK